VVKSPSKFLSIKFLQELKAERYLSPQGKEYCAEEVDDLLNEKLCAYATKCETEYMRELSRMALELQHEGGPIEIINQGEAMEIEGGEVLSLTKKLKEKEERAREQSRLKCCECGHEVANEDDWLMGMDLPPSKDDPTGAQDSGIYVCPKCEALQDHTILDDMVKMNHATGDIESTIPGFLLDDLTGLDEPTSGAKFNVGTAIVNAIRMDLLRRYGEGFIDQCFPSERAWLRQKLNQMEA
jgi:hypothetical protein